DLDGVLVTEVIGPLDGVVRVRFPGVLRVERRVDPALGRIGMRSDRMNLRDDPDRRPRLRRGESGTLAREARPNDQYVVLRHAARSLFTPRGEPRSRGAAAAARLLNDGH